MNLRIRDFGVLFSSFILTAQADVTVTNVVARQNWPWSADVYVEYVLGGNDSALPVDMTLTATDNGQTVTIPESAISGKRHALTTNGLYRLVIDPSKVDLLKSKGTTSNFKVSLSAASSPDYVKEVLYKIFDLGTTNVTDVTYGDLVNGTYGAYSTDLPWIQNSWVKTNENAHPIVWTGVTNDFYYATNAIVMRKIPASNGTFKMGSATITLTNDYWMSVFECTQSVSTKLLGGKFFSMLFTVDGARRSANQTPFYAIRELINSSGYCGAAPDYGWPTNSTPENPCVGPTSFMGVLRTYFNNAYLFDLCTEAQWEYACLAGTAETTWNDGSSIGNLNLDINLDKLGRYGYNGGNINTNANDRSKVYWNWNDPVCTGVGPTNAIANVGTYLPNAWGLYDMHGNIEELCLDISGNSPTADVTNPIGALSGANRITCGGNWGNGARNCRASSRNTRASGTVSAGVGFRIAIPFPQQ